jgi:ABC-2 type transport system ATP-binding protein
MPSPDPSAAPLELRKLRREFGAHVAVEDLSFQINRGEVVGLLGANGAGKTTAMSAIMGLSRPTSGEIRIFGLCPFQQRIAALRRCNFSSAYTSLPGNLTVWQNLNVFARIYQVKQPKAKIAEVLERFEISHLQKRITGELSAGEAARLHLCKALLNDPELLLLDEPTASLDPDITDKVRKVIRQIQSERGISILYTSHNMRDIEEVCDRVIFMRRGRVVTQGTPREIVERFEQNNMEDAFIRIVRDGALEDIEKEN